MRKVFKQWPVAAAMALLAACGGGSDSASDSGGGDQNVAIRLDGTAAIGAPLANASLTVQGANDKFLTASADATGAYSFGDVSALTEPLMIRAIGMAGGQEYTLYSVAADLPEPGQTVVANVTPMTHALVTQALGDEPTLEADVDLETLNLVKSQLATAMAQVYEALGIASEVDPFSTPFVANGEGLDKVLDLIAFNTNLDGSEPKFYVVEKGVGASVEVTTNPVVLGAPQGADIDTSGIATLIENFNKYAAAPAEKAFQDLFDVNFLDYGQTREALFSGLEEEGMKLGITNFAINGCKKVAEVSQCTVVGSLTEDGQPIERLEMLVVLTDDGWKLYGNQSPIDFDLKPVYLLSAEEAFIVNRAAAAKNGFNLYIPVDNEGFQAKSATLTFVVNGNATELLFAGKGNCDYLSFDSEPCSNLVVFRNLEEPQMLNNAISAGKLLVKIEVQTEENEIKTHEFLVRTPFFTAATGNAAHKITVSGVGSQQVGFSGGGLEIDYLNVFVNSSVENSNWWGYATWSDADEVNTLRDIVSVEKARAQAYCDPNTCDQQFSPVSGRIQQVFITGRDALGRSLWLSVGNQNIE